MKKIIKELAIELLLTSLVFLSESVKRSKTGSDRRP